MRSRVGQFGRVTSLVAGGLFLLASVPATAIGQRAPEPLDRGDGDHVTIQSLQARNISQFRLFGEGDRGVAGLRPTGTFQHYVTNTGINDAADLDMQFQPQLFGCSNCNPSQFQGFDWSPIYAAGREEWVRFLETVPSLENATGGGYSVSRNQPSLGLSREILASDQQFGILFSGTQSTIDGGCQDFSDDGPSGNTMSEGLTLLAISNCPPTFPLVNGVPTFGGADPNFGGGINPPNEAAFLDAQATLGSDFSFQWWRLDRSLLDPAKTFGNIATYGAYDDFNSALIGLFGEVVPGGAGDPDNEGWPLGLRTEFHAFTFALPTVANTMFWRAIIINETEQVYGVGLDYEKLYVGYTDNKAHDSQESVFYHQVWRGVIAGAEGDTGNPSCPGVPPPDAAFIDCVGDQGFESGGDAFVVLKSPIGDLRNVLLTCSPAENATRAATDAIPCPTNAFNDPSNPQAGDTITYNHHRMCPFGPCSDNSVEGPEIQVFGAHTSNDSLFLNGRDPASLPGRPGYDTFRNPNWPQDVTPFSFWVPGSWDYSANGDNAGGDTIFVPTCYGPPGVVIQGTTREDRDDACVVTWSDTMPVGERGNPAYNNQEGNISYMMIGPFALAAGDTTALVLAKMSQIDSTSVEAEIDNIVDLYMNFWLSPEAPPKVNIVGVDVQVEDPQLGQGRGEVTLFWDDASDDFVDPFLESFADNLVAAAAGTELARIRTLNPGLEAKIRARARDNLERILIFKSCDGGGTFTASDTQEGVQDCDGDPAEDLQGSNIGAGWQSYATLPVVQGEAPNSFTDDLIIPGQSFLYAVSGQTRGANFAIVDSVDTDGDGAVDELGPDSLLLAPSLINPLATSTTESNVVSVYVPASNQAGSQLAAAEVVAADSFTATLTDQGRAEVRFTGGEVTEARYRAIFANEFVIETVRDAEGNIDSATVTASDIVFATRDGVTPENITVDQVVVGSGNPNGVSLKGEISGSGTMPMGSGTVTTDTVSAFGLFLWRSDTGEPLFVSTDLDGTGTTPPTLFGRTTAGGTVTGFPGFVVNVDNEDAGDFDFQQYEQGPGGALIPNQISPTVSWDQGNSVANQVGDGGVGRYNIIWSGRTFGPNSPFALNLQDPSVTDAAFDASIEARAVGSTGLTDSIAAAAITAAGTPVSASGLVAVRAPFQVRNALQNRDVDIAMVRRADNTLLLGNRGTGDTLSVTVAEDAWVPGDNVFLIETVEVDSTVTIDINFVPTQVPVVDGDDNIIKTQATVASFAPAILSCGNLPRPGCNPVSGQLGNTFNWVTNAQDQSLRVEYVPPLSLESFATFDAQRAISGQDAIDSGRDIAASMDSIKVVPNPYIMFARWEIDSPQENDKRLLFTHLPPTGILRIFTVTGQFVQELTWEPSDLVGNGDLYWDMRTREGNDVGAGLYVFTVQANNPATGAELKKIGKFVIIR